MPVEFSNVREALFALGVACITFILTVLWGDPFLEVLRRLRIGKRIRIDGPESHFAKLGTPTMGGFLFIVPVVAVTLVLNLVSLVRPVTGRSILLPLGAMLAYAALGAYDDWQGIHGRRAKSGEGILGRYKFLIQVLIGLVIASILNFGFGHRSLAIPGYPQTINLSPWLYIPIVIFVITATTNAVNMTDGLDGLAGLVVSSAFLAYGLIALLQGQIYLSRFCFVMVGALFAFLWFNVYPAALFMGDVGSMGLGAALAVVAFLTGQWALLVLICCVPLAETASVMIQVASAKLSRKYLGRDIRPFKMTPLHHHFEQLGWSEPQITQRFWLISILSAMLGILLAIL